MPSHSLLTRHYVHGDLHADRPGIYYCAHCDYFEPAEHFTEPDHVKKRATRYASSLNAWLDRQKEKTNRFFRPKDAENILADLAEQDVKNEKASRSRFFRWLLRQTKRDDPVGDFARDAASDSTFPRTTSEYEALDSYLFRADASSLAALAFEAAWSECNSNGKGRQSISLTLRFTIFKRDGYRCCLCGASARDKRRLEVDHKVAVANGGTSDESNLWTLCFDCNRGKSTSDL